MEIKSEFNRIYLDSILKENNSLGKILNKELLLCEYDEYSKIDYYQFETSLIEGEVILGGISGIVEGQLLTIEHMFVSKRLRGKKLGVKLLNSLENEAKKYNVKQIFLESIDIHNVDFYTNNGFEIFGKVVINMEKNLFKIFLKKST